jgi:hypothetical protein
MGFHDTSHHGMLVLFIVLPFLLYRVGSVLGGNKKPTSLTTEWASIVDILLHIRAPWADNLILDPP